MGSLAERRVLELDCRLDLVEPIGERDILDHLLGFTILDLLNVPLGIGFGAQTICNDFISGWILMWERPIRIGDFIDQVLG